MNQTDWLQVMPPVTLELRKCREDSLNKDPIDDLVPTRDFADWVKWLGIFIRDDLEREDISTFLDQAVPYRIITRIAIVDSSVSYHWYNSAVHSIFNIHKPSDVPLDIYQALNRGDRYWDFENTECDYRFYDSGEEAWLDLVEAVIKVVSSTTVQGFSLGEYRTC